MRIRRSIECWLFSGELSLSSSVLLLQVAAKPEHPAYWQPITGGIETAETEEQACLREVWEETGLVLDLSRLTRLDRRLDVEIDHALTVRKTLFLATTDTREVQISEEHIAWRWLLFCDARSVLYWPSSRETYEVVADWTNSR